MSINTVKPLMTGKRGEYAVIGKLLERGFTVYVPVLDIEGIDCIIRNKKGRLIEIQIKTRHKNEEEGRYFIVRNLKPHSDLFICCYMIDTNEIWMIPSFVYNKLAGTKGDGSKFLPMSLERQRELSKYKDNLGFELLKLGNLN